MAMENILLKCYFLFHWITGSYCGCPANTFKNRNFYFNVKNQKCRPVQDVAAAPAHSFVNSKVMVLQRVKENWFLLGFQNKVNRMILSSCCNTL